MDLQEFYSEYRKGRPSFGTRIAGYFPPVADWRTKAVLDVGCGDGGIASAFAAMGADTTAIERDAGRVAQIVKRNPAFKLLRGDAHHLPFKRQAFDFAILADVLEHVRDSGAVLGEVARVLRPGGEMYVGTTSRTSIPNLFLDPHYKVPFIPIMSKRMARWYVTQLCKVSTTFTVEKYFFRGELVRSISSAGFSVESIPGYQEKLLEGSFAHAPGRAFLRRMISVPTLRKAAVWFAGTRAFELFVAPGFGFLCTRLDSE
jgi:ubiquinone/menaquinone biosynthesis C-methylase UbiE